MSSAVLMPISFRHRTWFFFAMLAAALLLSLGATPAVADDGPIDYVRVDGHFVDNGETIRVTRNEVEIRVGFDDNHVTALKIGSVASFTYSDSDGELEVDDSTGDEVDAHIRGDRAEVGRYPLKIGKNTVTIAATVDGSGSSGSDQNTCTITIDYIDEPLEDASFRVEDITAVTKVQAFDKAFALDFQKKSYLMDGNEAADDQSLTITVVEVDAPPRGFVTRSPVYRIDTDDEDYTLSHAATLTITFDPYTSTGAASELTVYYVPDTDGDFARSSARNLGGIVKSNAITATLNGPISGCYMVCAAAGDFTDFGRLGWAYHSVTPLWAKGIIEPYGYGNDPWRYGYQSGVGGGYFGFYQDSAGQREVKISRGEFTVMIVKALGLSHDDRIPGASFPDFNSVDQDYRPYLETAVARGLLRGAPNGSCPVIGFGAALTREQAAVILARAAELKVDSDMEKVHTGLQKEFADYAANPSVIGPWAGPAVLACCKAKLMNGIPTGEKEYQFRARDPLTRIQATALVHRLMLNKKLI